MKMMEYILAALVLVSMLSLFAVELGIIVIAAKLIIHFLRRSRTGMLMLEGTLFLLILVTLATLLGIQGHFDGVPILVNLLLDIGLAGLVGGLWLILRSACLLRFKVAAMVGLVSLVGFSLPSSLGAEFVALIWWMWPAWTIAMILIWAFTPAAHRSGFLHVFRLDTSPFRQSTLS